MTASTYIQTYDGCVQVARTLARRVYEAVDQCMNGVEPAETVFPDLFNGVNGTANEHICAHFEMRDAEEDDN